MPILLEGSSLRREEQKNYTAFVFKPFPVTILTFRIFYIYEKKKDSVLVVYRNSLIRTRGTPDVHLHSLIVLVSAFFFSKTKLRHIPKIN